jgi:hypothetical protein
MKTTFKEMDCDDMDGWSRGNTLDFYSGGTQFEFIKRWQSSLWSFWPKNVFYLLTRVKSVKI